MHDFRRLEGWISLLLFRIDLHRLLNAFDRHDGLPPFVNLFIVLFAIVLATVEGVTWWSLFKEKRPRRGQVVGAFLLFFLFAIAWNRAFSQAVWLPDGFVLAAGVAGVAGFLLRDE